MMLSSNLFCRSRSSPFFPAVEVSGAGGLLVPACTVSVMAESVPLESRGPGFRSLLSHCHHLSQGPGAVLTKHHKRGASKQQTCTLSWFLSLGVPKEGASRALPLFVASVQLRVWSVTLGAPWLEAQSLQPLSPLSHSILLVCPCLYVALTSSR